MVGAIGIGRGLTGRALAGALLATTILGGAMPAFAQSAQASAAKHFDIPAQSLADAIALFGRQSGLQVTASNDVVAGKSSSSISGALAPAEALSRLLAGTGLTFQYISANAVRIERAPHAAEGSIQLGPVRVEGDGGNGGSGYAASLTTDPSATEGTNSYTATGPSKTATGLALTLRETPQSVTIITRQKMDDFNLQTLEDVLKQTPGIAIAKMGDDLEFYARGGKIDNFQVDGSRSGNGTVSTGVISASNLAFDDLAEIDRVEVLRGSAGLLQGDGYPTATVNMIRKKPTKDFRASIGVSAGSWDTYRSDVDISGPLTQNGNIRGRAVAAYKSANSYRDNVQNHNMLLYGTLDFDLTPDTLLNIGIDYKDRQNTGNAGYQGAVAYNDTGEFVGWTSRSWNAAAPFSGYDQKNLTVMATLEHRFANGWEARLHLSRDKSEIPDWINANINAPVSGTSPNLQRYKDLESVTNNANLDIKGSFNLFGRSHELLLGANFSRNDYQMDLWRAPAEWRATTQLVYQALLADPSYYIKYGGSLFPKPDETWDIRYQYRTDTQRLGGYATTRLNFADNLKLILGTRLSNYRYNYTYRNVYLGANALWGDIHTSEKGVFTPYAGLIYDLNRNFSFYASYANVFQPVTVQDEEGKVLDPQKGVTYEIGSKSEFYDGRLNVAVAYFWKRWENTYELSGGLTPTGSAAYRNVNGAMEHGFELELSGELAPGWQAQAGYTMLGERLENNFDGGVPKHKINLNTSYRLPGAFQGLTVGAGARWQSSIDQDMARFGYPDAKLAQKSYWLVDLTARHRTSKNLSAGININNLFDKKYFAGINSMALFGNMLYYTWGEPRSITFNIRHEF